MRVRDDPVSHGMDTVMSRTPSVTLTPFPA